MDKEKVRTQQTWRRIKMLSSKISCIIIIIGRTCVRTKIKFGLRLYIKFNSLEKQSNSLLITNNNVN